jgi:hypothetical protein
MLSQLAQCMALRKAAPQIYSPPPGLGGDRRRGQSAGGREPVRGQGSEVRGQQGRRGHGGGGGGLTHCLLRAAAGSLRA